MKLTQRVRRLLYDPQDSYFLIFIFLTKVSKFFLLMGQLVPLSLCFSYIIMSFSNYTALYFSCLRQKQKLQRCKLIVKYNNLLYIALFVVNTSIKKLFSIYLGVSTAIMPPEIFHGWFIQTTKLMSNILAYNNFKLTNKE